MLNERRLAVETVAAAFLPTEHAAEQTAILGARCIAAMIEQRVAAGLPLDTGAEAFALEAVMDLEAGLIHPVSDEYLPQAVPV